jgi:AraC-like DNA-binding protein
VVVAPESALSALFVGHTSKEVVMKTLFSTREVHPRDRFDYWHEVACKLVVDHHSRPENRRSFQAELRADTLGELGIILFGNSPMAISHTAAHAAHAANELFVCRQVAGRVSLEQDGREAVLDPGDITLLEPRLPYQGKFLAGSRMLVLKVPRRLLEARLGNMRDMTALAPNKLAGEHSLASAVLAMLPAHSGRLGTAEEVVQNQVLDLIAISLSKAIQGARPRVSSARMVARMNVRAAVEVKLTEPTLDATTVAAAAGVSVRYANAVLAEENTSIVRLIQARRLERCRRALEDPAHAHRTISEIAYGWGFSDMTHFGRRFKAAYGLLPGEHRKAFRRQLQ